MLSRLLKLDTTSAVCLSLLIGVLLGAAEIPAAISLEKGDLDIKGCMKPSRLDPNVCYWGMSRRPGCTGACGDAVLPATIVLRLACRYRISGQVVEARTGAPRRSLPVDLIVAGRTRYRTRTRDNGAFLLEIAADAEAADCVQHKEFGRMSIEADTPKIILLGSLSARFWAAHSHLKPSFKKAADLARDDVDRSD